MLIRYLLKNSGEKYRILAIDADPDATNLADAKWADDEGENSGPQEPGIERIQLKWLDGL